MTYKVGEKVVIKANLDDVTNVNPKMKKYCGKTMTIREIDGNSYRMQEDSSEHVGTGWYWSEDMIEGLSKKENKIEVGDVVRLKSSKLTGEFAGLSEKMLRHMLGKNVYLVHEVSITGRVRIDGKYVNVDNVELVAKGIKKEEPKKHKWTEIEIQKADKIAKEILIDLYDRNISTVFYVSPKTVVVNGNFGYPCLNEVATAKCFEGDEPNETIGKCVALCKLVGKKIPNFILNHNDHTSDKEELVEKLKSEGYNWIARDEDGQLCAFVDKPKVLFNFWARRERYKVVYSDYFTDVTWIGGPVKL